MVSTENKIIAVFGVSAFLLGYLVATTPGLPAWAGPGVVIVVGVVCPQLVLGYLESPDETA